MGLLDLIFGKRPDPTLGWGTFKQPIPDFDLTSMRFGGLGFGDGFESASFLGRADKCDWSQGDYCELLYASGGFQLDFKQERFAYAAFFIGPDDYLPKHPELAFSRPRLRGCTPDGVVLSQDTDRAAVERLFAAPDEADAEPSEVILYYTRQGVAMEFELDGATGGLKRWNLYPK